MMIVIQTHEHDAREHAHAHKHITCMVMCVYRNAVIAVRVRCLRRAKRNVRSTSALSAANVDEHVLVVGYFADVLVGKSAGNCWNPNSI